MKPIFRRAASALLVLTSVSVQADWYFRGTPNGWGTDALTDLGNGMLETCQTFNGEEQPARFKIDRLGDWSEAFPSEDYQVNDQQSYRITFNTATQAVAASPVANCDGDTQDAWYFRGTPNGWATTAMEDLGDGQFGLCQHFNGEGSPARFKIDRYGDWTEAYPSQDYVVADDAYYQIAFDANSREVSATEVSSCGGTPVSDWFFRGTPNNWGKAALSRIDDTRRYEIRVSFNGEDANARFKIDNGNWTESYPGTDYVVDDFADYHIVFDELSKSLTVTKEQQQIVLQSISLMPSGSLQMQTGEGLQLQVFAQYSDGSSSEVTSQASYASNNTQVATISSSGWLAAQNDGFANISVSFEGKTAGLSAQVGDIPNTGDFREETIYFVMTARFNDGDSSNNYFNRDRLNEDDPTWRGDFKGLIDKLDYIQDLGFTAIWVTPPVENRSGLDYHGYHAYDWMRVDPRLESPGATYQDFINAAHARGMKVIQDVVINHSSQYGVRDQVWIDHLPIKYYRDAACTPTDLGPYQGNPGDYASEFRDDNDNPVAPVWFRERHSSDAAGELPLVDPKTGVTVPSCGYDPNRFFGIDAATLDPDWYHLDGFMSGGDWENPGALQRKHMAGDTIDLATGNQNVKDYLNNAIRMYLDMGVDAIRLDTAKHIERDELLEYVHNWQAHKPGLFVFGEVLVKGLGFGSELANDNASAVIRPWWYTRSGSDPSNPQGDSGHSVLDFPLFSTFRDNVTRGSFGGVGGALGWDWTYADPTQLVTFFQNHDVGPDNDFKYRYCCDNGNAALAYNLLWTIRGIPSLYYGEEIAFMAGAPQDIQGSNDVVAETGRAYYGEHLTGAGLAASQSHPLYRHIKRLNAIRSAIPALQKGQMERVNEWGAGMSFSRSYNDGGSFAVVGLAAASGQNISVSGIPNGIYRDAVTGNSINVSNGEINFFVNAYSAGVYVLNGPGKIGQDGDYLR